MCCILIKGGFFQKFIEIGFDVDEVFVQSCMGEAQVQHFVF
jgi:hypothetical protein